jgi:aspartate/methionine/tyrosine aminotransferase
MLDTYFPNTKILTDTPFYINHKELSGMFDGGKFYSQPRVDKFADIHTYTKNDYCLLFCTPSNPIGKIEDWERLEAKLYANDNPIILDEAFAEVIFTDPNNYSLLHRYPDLADRVVLLRSGTKALGLAGERLSVVRVPEKYIDPFVELQSRFVGNAPLSAQAGMAAALSEMSVAEVKKISSYYLENYNLLAASIGNIVSTPMGGFFVLADFSKLMGQPIPKEAEPILEKSGLIESDEDIAISLLFTHKIALIPASYFGIDKAKGYCRISYSIDRSELAELAKRINLI